MAAVTKSQNISNQPSKVARSSTENKLVMQLDNLTKNEINQKSTSDKTKRRVAHVAKFPLPVIKKPISPAEKKDNPEKKTRKQMIPKQKKPKAKIPENDFSKKVQNLGTQHTKMQKLRNLIAATPWSYSEMYFGRNIYEKRKSDVLESTKMTTKKSKSN